MAFDSLVDAASAVFVFGSLAVLALAMRLRIDGLRLIYEISLPVGLVGFLIGVISMLAAESDPGQIAPALAIAVLTIVYSGIVRILLIETESLALPTELSNAAKMLSSAGILAFMGWAMTWVTQGNVAVYWYPQVMLLLAGFALLVFLVSRAVSAHHQTGWAAKVMNIGWLGFSFGVVAGLRHLDSPQSMGPAIAFSFSSLLYALIAIVVGLIWAPSTMADRNGALTLGLGFAATVTVSVVAILAVLVSVLP